MDQAGQASTDCKFSYMSDALKESIMSKFTVFARSAVYPAVALLSLIAASAHAQSVNDPVDQAAYGPMPAAATARVAAPAAKAQPAAVVAQAKRFFSGNSTQDFDPVDHAGYGPMVANTTSLRTRAEVRAEAIAARDAGMEANWREGGDPQYAILKRAKAVDTDHLVAGAPAKAAR